MINGWRDESLKRLIKTVIQKESKMKIVEGKFYKTRDGRKVGPMREVSCVGWLADSGRVGNGCNYDWYCDYDWYKDGTYECGGKPSKHDLMEEYKDDAQMFKVGDILRYVGEVNEYGYYTVGKLYTITTVGTMHYEITDNQTSDHYWNEEAMLESFEKATLIEVKPSSPVQSRKTIVEGEYGNLSIYYKHDQPKTLDNLRIEVTTSKHTASELREMIGVLGDIVEFLEEVG